jgi:nucleoside-diphosphate-sugar epimerase
MDSIPQTKTDDPGAALVFGANSEQGRAVVEGLADAGYHPVYSFTREKDHDTLHYLQDGLGAIILEGDLQNPDHVQKALKDTAAQSIFLVTSTELPTEIGQTSGFSDAAENEYQVIVLFFQILVDVYKQDKLARHVVFSVRDNVQARTLKVLQETGDLWISPLEDDGSIVPHFTAKGKGGEYAVEYLQNYPDLKLTLLTMPFLYSNFLGFFAPLRDETGTQWMLTACFGDGTNKIDMMGASDLAKIVRTYRLLTAILAFCCCCASILAHSNYF